MIRSDWTSEPTTNVAVLVMALVAPRLAGADLARHSLVVSLGSLILTAMALFLMFVVGSSFG